MGTTHHWRCRDRVLEIGDRPLVMGILNVTPDSFSDGGRHFDHAQAIADGLRMIEQGADILDVGGESTRPGAAEVTADEESRRVVPVIAELCRRSRAAVSVDTTKAVVAGRAIEAGACIVNDVSALTLDAGMPDLVRESQAGAVLMHMRGSPRTMQQNPEYGDVVEEVTRYLEGRVEALRQAGIAREALAVDPGIGFGKTVAHNVQLLASLHTLSRMGLPVVVGLSRKSFLGKLTGREVGDRLAGSLAGLVFCVLHGASIVRVHDVKESCDAVKVASILAGELKEKHAAVEQH